VNLHEISADGEAAANDAIWQFQAYSDDIWRFYHYFGGY
jgi:hypothetical protein